MAVDENDISNQQLFDLLVKVAGRLDVMEMRFEKLENELAFLKNAFAAIKWINVKEGY